MTGFDYFDGREWAGNEFREDEMGGVEVEFENHEVLVAADGRYQRQSTMRVEPPERLLYPRPVESLDELRALYVADELTIGEFEHYAEDLLS